MHKIEKQINIVYNDLMEISEMKNIDPKILQSQIFHETGYLEHMLPNSNNLFNIKSKKDDDLVARKLGININKRKYKVWEVIDGKRIEVEDYFRVYESIHDSLIDYIEFINSRTLTDIFERYGNDCIKYFETLQKIGYQTDPKYSENLVMMYNFVSCVWYDRMELIKMVQELLGENPDGFLGPITKRKYMEKR